MIGIFDSGIGGLTVVRQVMQQLPGFSIVYLGDTARTPYGTKGPETISRYALQDARFLIEHGAQMLVVACNTMSAVAIRELRDRLLVPIFDVVRPAAEEAARVSARKRIGVIGTRATINSKIYKELVRSINPDTEIFAAACPLFVPLVEEGWAAHDVTRRVVETYLGPLKLKRIDTLILGCTHYPFLRSVIGGRMGRSVRLVDSAEAVVRHMKAYLDAHPAMSDRLEKGNRHEFYLTDIAPHHEELASQWLGHRITFRHADLEPQPERHVK